jgi:hypothetical protein
MSGNLPPAPSSYVDPFLARIEDSEVLLSLVANWEARARLHELVQRWAVEAKMPHLLAGSLWSAMAERVIHRRKEAFPKLFDAVMARKKQKAQAQGGGLVSPGLQDGSEPPVELMPKSKDVEGKPLTTDGESRHPLDLFEPESQELAHTNQSPVITPPRLSPEATKAPTLSPAPTEVSSVPPKPTELFKLPLDLFIARLEELDLLHEHDIRGLGKRLGEAGVTPDLIPSMDNGELESLLGPGTLKIRLFVRRAVRWESYHVCSGV